MLGHFHVGTDVYGWGLASSILIARLTHAIIWIRSCVMLLNSPSDSKELARVNITQDSFPVKGMFLVFRAADCYWRVMLVLTAQHSWGRVFASPSTQVRWQVRLRQRQFWPETLLRCIFIALIGAGARALGAKWI